MSIWYFCMMQLYIFQKTAFVFYYILNHNYNWSRYEEITQERVFRLRTCTRHRQIKVVFLNWFVVIKYYSSRNVFLYNHVIKQILITITKYVTSGTENRNLIFVSVIEKSGICFKNIFISKCPKLSDVARWKANYCRRIEVNPAND